MCNVNTYVYICVVWSVLYSYTYDSKWIIVCILYCVIFMYLYSYIYTIYRLIQHNFCLYTRLAFFSDKKSFYPCNYSLHTAVFWKYQNKKVWPQNWNIFDKCFVLSCQTFFSKGQDGRLSINLRQIKNTFFLFLSYTAFLYSFLFRTIFFFIKTVYIVLPRANSARKKCLQIVFCGVSTRHGLFCGCLRRKKDFNAFPRKYSIYINKASEKLPKRSIFSRHFGIIFSSWLSQLFETFVLPLPLMYQHTNLVYLINGQFPGIWNQFKVYV